MITWDDVHAGDVVLGHDGQEWGVESIAPHPAGPVITIVRHGQRLVAQPPPGTPITRLAEADVSAEAHAFATLTAAGLGPVVLWESYQP